MVINRRTKQEESEHPPLMSGVVVLQHEVTVFSHSLWLNSEMRMTFKSQTDFVFSFIQANCTCFGTCAKE